MNFGEFRRALSVLAKWKEKSNVVLVIYCHGWNNNSQSDDVIHFVTFVRRLANSLPDPLSRVEGVYLSWHGSEYQPVSSKEAQIEEEVLERDFGGPIVDTKWHNSRLVGTLLAPAKYLSYWSIKNLAEFRVSKRLLPELFCRLPSQLKNPEELRRGRKHRVFVIGHSFGALVFEQTMGQASLGLVSPWTREQPREARWPFDLVVFLNSAAPSIYAKGLGEFLEEGSDSTAEPLIVSLTSSADWATGLMHPLGNITARFSPGLQRVYHPFGPKSQALRGWQYYAQTPGHNRALINREIMHLDNAPSPRLSSDDEVFRWNLRVANPPNTFLTRSRTDGKIDTWKIRRVAPAFANSFASQYWVVTVPPAIIRNHNDIWSLECMEMLAGVYRSVERLSHEPAAAIESGE